MSPGRGPAGLAGAVLVAWALAAPAGVAAQTPTALAAACTTAGGDAPICLATALAGEALVGQLGVAAGYGSEVSGTATTLGQRLGSAPRVSPAFRVGLVRTATPDPDDPAGLGERTSWVSSLQGSVTFGLFDGFRLMPTVGGFLSVDAFGQAAWVLLPVEEGFGGRVSAYSLGARIGILREGFTLPGVSVSVARRFLGDARLGDRSAGSAGEIGVDPSVTSLRATIGKDLFALEIMGGIGWDDYSADAIWRVSDGGGGTVTGAGTFDGTRRLYFVGASMSFNIVFSLSLEGGIAQGFDPVDGYAGAYDPTASRGFGSLAFRLIV